VYLKRLELQGFKSFASRTALELHPGITAIVGLNGSGKSNLADAVRWVLGEQSPRQVRGRKPQDVIWNGTSGRPAVGMAEVHLTLDNGDGWLDTPFTEVTVARRALRSGETDYLINRARVRMKDVTDLLAKGAQATDGYGLSADRAVLGQGSLDALLAMRPAERVSAFEDAAGVRPFQHQRDDASARLQETRDNLTRLDDIAGEIAPQLPRLKRAAERATRAAELTQAEATCSAQWYRLRLDSCARELARGCERLQRAQRDADGASAACAALERQLAENDAALAQAHAALRTAQRSLQERESAHQAARNLASVLDERRAASDREARLLAETLTELEARLSERIQAREHATTNHLQEEAALARDRTALDTARATLTEPQKLLGAADRQASQARLRATALERDVDRLRHDETSIERRIAALDQQQSNSLGDATHKARDLHAAEAARRAAEQQVAIKENALTLAEAHQRDAQDEFNAGQRALETARQALLSAAHDRDRIEGKLEALHDLQRTLVGAGLGTRTLWEQRSSFPGLLGVVAQFLDVQPGYERAIRAALGPVFEALVTSERTTALQALASALARGEAVAFLVESWMTSPSEERGHDVCERLATAVGAGYFGLARDFARACGPAAEAIEFLLAPWIVVRDEQAGVATLRALQSETHVHALNVVTIDGVVMGAAGVVRFGLDESSLHLVERRHEIGDLQARREAACQRCVAAEQHAEEVSLLVQRRCAEVQEADQRTQEARNEHRSAHAALSAAQSTFDRLATEQLFNERRREELGRELRTLRDELATIKVTIPVETIKLEAVRAEAQRAAAEADQHRRTLALRQRSIGATQTALALSSQRLMAAKTALEQVELSERQVLAELQRTRGRAHELAQRQNELQRGQTERASAIAHEANRIGQLQAEVADVDTRVRELQRHVADGRAREPEARAAWSEAMRQLQDATADVERHRALQFALVGQIEQDLGLAPDNLPVVPSDEDEAALRARREALRASLRQIGQVNPEAAADYATLFERHTRLTEQIADVRDSVDELMHLVDELGCKIAQRFADVFERTAEAFQQYFSRLFPGGEGRLRHVRDDVGASSIEITVRLPGKKAQDLALLSGGERSLVSVALLFAMLDARPTPFCLLDEADAALDDANVGRFVALLSELAKRTQFIVITHNRGTMHAAGALYGVAMQPDGTSRLVSWRLESLAV
jgi:chromosome segregation protein